MVNIRNDFEYRDGHLYRAYSDRRVKAGDAFGCLVPSGYIEGFYNGVKVGEHVLIWEWHNGPVPSGKWVDHKDTIRNNNQIENLRLCDVQQNAYNRGLNANSKTGIKGLLIANYPTKQYWDARYSVNGKRIRKLFPFTDEGKEQAIEWLHKGREAAHGEFTNHGSD